MLNRKVPVKIVKVKLARDVKHFSVWHLLVFVLLFAGIGGYIIYHSLALIPTEPTAPSQPTNLIETTLPGGVVNLDWAASSDQSVTGYKIYQYTPSVPEPGEDSPPTSPSIYLGTTTQTSFQVTGLETNSAYDFYVVAVDSSGNASDSTNHVQADTSDPQLTTAGSLNNQYATTSGSTSSSFPYASPFGDQNCDNKRITTGTSDDCVKSCTGSSNCGGSCLTVPRTDTLGNTGTCRPMSMQTCPQYQGEGQPHPTLEPSQIDMGVDYNVYLTDSGCTYNNPNPKDTEAFRNSPYDPTKPSTPGNAKTNTRIYAMGNGKLVCVTANPGMQENLTLTQYCLDHKGPIGPGNGTWLAYELTSAGAAKGLKIYVAEGCNLASNAINDVTAPASSSDLNSPGHRNLGRRWKADDHVTKNSVLCEISKGTIEMGWAGQLAYNFTAAGPCYNEKKGTRGNWSTPWGHSFNLFVLTSDANRFSGTRGPHAFNGCQDFPLQAIYQNSAWY